MLKKGELTSGEIVGIVLVLAGVIILLLFLPTFVKIFKGTDSRELCQLSVIARATTPSIAQEGVPLRCTTEKICISDNGGDDCSQFAGEEVFDSISLEGRNDLERVNEIEKTIADSMLNCWQIMGEGKLDLFGDVSTAVNFADKQPRCVVCSRIAINQEDDIRNRVDVPYYLDNERPVNSTGKTYSEVFAGVGVQTGQEDIGDKEEASDQVAVVFMQILTSSTPWESSLKTAAGGFVVYGSLALSPIVGKLVTNPWIAAIAGIGITGTSVYSGIQSYQGRETAAGFCGEFTSADKARKGCSIVRLVEWSPENVNGINEFCSGGIEGNL